MHSGHIVVSTSELSRSVMTPVQLIRKSAVTRYKPVAEALATWSPTYRDQTKRLTAEETDVLARAIKEQKRIIYESSGLPPKQAEAAKMWKDIAAIFTLSFGIIRASAQCRKRYNDVWNKTDTGHRRTVDQPGSDASVGQSESLDMYTVRIKLRQVPA